MFRDVKQIAQGHNVFSSNLNPKSREVSTILHRPFWEYLRQATGPRGFFMAMGNNHESF